MSALEMKDDIGFQKKQWRAERLGWVAILIFLLLACAGLFGHGPLSNKRLTTEGIELSYERFIRNGADTVVDVRMHGPTAETGRRVVWIDSGFLEKIDIEHVEPMPEETRFLRDGVEYVFAARDAEEPRFSVRYRPRNAGRLQAEVRIPGSEPLVFKQFVYP